MLPLFFRVRMTKRTSDKDIEYYEEEILYSIGKIEEYIFWLDLPHFVDDEKTFDACSMKLQHIGECGIKLESLTWPEYKNIPFRVMAGFRNRISHDYGGIDNSVVWKVIQKSLPELKKKLS